MLEITAQVISDMRSYYPEFGDSADWTDATLTRYLEEAVQETGSQRWGGYKISPASLKARGMFAYTAHKAALGKMREQALLSGMTPTAPKKVAGKTVGDESIQYETTALEAGQAVQTGDLNKTIYGEEFLRLRKRASMGIATTGQVRV